jgi:hypothetical protein
MSARQPRDEFRFLLVSLLKCWCFLQSNLASFSWCWHYDELLFWCAIRSIKLAFCLWNSDRSFQSLVLQGPIEESINTWD